MTFAEVSETVKLITCGRFRAKAQKIGRKYFKITVSHFNTDKDREILCPGEGEAGFYLSDERIFDNKTLAHMDQGTVIEQVRDIMLSIHMHEFHEFFKFNNKTVSSPHLPAVVKQ